MTDVQRLLARQTEWQKNRATLSWPEKIRMVEAIRDSVVKLGASKPTVSSQRDPSDSGTSQR